MIRYEDIPGDYYFLDEENFRIIGETTGTTIQLGDDVKVRVKSVDLLKHRMDFELASPPKKTKKKKKA